MGTFGERIKEMIEELQITPHELGRMVGFKTPSGIYSIISDKRSPSVKFLEKLSESVPGADINYLVTGSKNEFRSRSVSEISTENQKMDVSILRNSDDPLTTINVLMSEVKRLEKELSECKSERKELPQVMLKRS